MFRLIEAEYERTCVRVLEVTDGGALAERFPQYRRRLGRRLQTMNQVSREQVQLLQRVRDGGDDEVRIALLLSIRCAAVGSAPPDRWRPQARWRSLPPEGAAPPAARQSRFRGGLLGREQIDSRKGTKP